MSDNHTCSCDNTVRKTVLYERHLALAGKARIQPFAGYLLPLWYSNIAAEHKAVRTAAGLFDVTHMGVLSVTGPASQAFLDHVATNNVAALAPNHAHYSYVLDENGQALDDIIVYCLGKNNYMVVVNASNNQKVQAWLAQVIAKRQDIFAPGSVTVRDIRFDSPGRIDLALQGPASQEILLRLLDPGYHEPLKSLKSFGLLQVKSKDLDIIIARTGYTGQKIAYELFIDASKALWLWDRILELGSDLRAVPCGLGARDSLRVEAGLPLYGHELDGPDAISPFQAGYSWAVKLDKPNFIGKDAIAAHAATYRSQIMRLSYPGEKGIRPIRSGDAILDSSNTCVGHVTSCAGVEEKQIALALVQSDKIEIDQPAGLYYAARNASQAQQGRLSRVEIGTKVESDLKGIVLQRFTKF